jgi:hypothetical protein
LKTTQLSTNYVSSQEQWIQINAFFPLINVILLLPVCLKEDMNI